MKEFCYFFIIIILLSGCASGKKHEITRFESEFNNPMYKGDNSLKRFFSSKNDRDGKKKTINNNSKSNNNPKMNKSKSKKIDHNELVSYALKFNNKKKFSYSKKFRNDCSGFVKMVYDKFGMDIFSLPREELKENGKWVNGSKLIYKYVSKNGNIFKVDTPKAGDIIFFDNTTDRNRDGKLNDYFTHVAIVLSIDNDGTINYIHKSNRGVNIQKMNLNHLNNSYLKKNNKKYKINSYLRKRRKGDSEQTRYLSAQMFRSFGRLLQDTRIAKR